MWCGFYRQYIYEATIPLYYTTYTSIRLTIIHWAFRQSYIEHWGNRTLSIKAIIVLPPGLMAYYIFLERVFLCLNLYYCYLCFWYKTYIFVIISCDWKCVQLKNIRYTYILNWRQICPSNKNCYIWINKSKYFILVI